MIVRHFLQWVRTAEAAERAEATSALARAYLYSDLSPDDRIAAEGAMIMLLDDPSPLVRHALADALGSSADAPAAVMHALVNDQPDIAAIVLERSPLLLDSDLVDSIAVGGARPAERDRAPRRRCRARSRPRSPKSARPEACLTLIENRRRRHRAVLARPHRGSASAISRRSARRCSPGPTCRPRPGMRWWSSCPRRSRASWSRATGWRRGGRSASRRRPARRRPSSWRRPPNREVSPLVGHLRETGQLTAGLVLRSLLSGNIDFFEQALAELAELPARARQRAGARPPRRAASRRSTTAPACRRRSIRRSAPRSRRCTRTADRRAGGNTRLKRRMVERVLTSCAGMPAGDVEPLMTLLRRYATEAAREEARLFCDELVEMGNLVPTTSAAAAA